MDTAVTVMWFRRDLRLHDHPALHAAADDAAVLPVFVLDPRLLRLSAVRRAYLIRSLRALDDSLRQRDGRLVVRAGAATEVIPALAREVGAAKVHVTCDCAPYGRARDTAVAGALGKDGRELVGTGSPYAVTPGRLHTGGGGSYRVFTPFYRSWLAHGWRPPERQSLAPIQWVHAGSAELPTDMDGMTRDLPEPGEVSARRRWRAFLAGDLEAYATSRNRPDQACTSQLSVHLRFGELHPRTLLADLAGRSDPGAVAWRRQLAWREFFADVLWHRPSSAWSPLREDMNDMAYETGVLADEWFAAWRDGETGFPFVDAGMRQLAATGWMHNRLRLVTSSFLVKDLHLDWRRGAALFLDRLVDGDVASNNHSWQWVAGTGTDAAPYHRVFNPVVQGKRFDPDGDYVRRWVPQLRSVAGQVVHEPWLLRDSAPSDYPSRIVDHDEQRREALERYGRRRLGN